MWERSAAVTIEEEGEEGEGEEEADVSAAVAVATPTIEECRRRSDSVAAFDPLSLAWTREERALGLEGQATGGGIAAAFAGAATRWSCIAVEKKV